jgi:hypothetical protein
VGSGKSIASRLSPNSTDAETRQRRSQETDYVLLHEIARHAVHVSEMLSVAVRSLGAVRQHHHRFSTERHLVDGKSKRRSWNAVGDHLDFQLRFLEGLVERSGANNARIQNEITLVSLRHGGCVSFPSSHQQAFNAAAWRDSRIQVRIGEDAKREASAMRAIAVVTMTFLPATFVAVSGSVRNSTEDTTDHLMQDSIWDELLLF